MRNRKRNDHGKFEREHSDEEFLEAVRECEPGSTTEIAEAVGVARQSADNRLRQLEDLRLVRKKKVGPALVWMVESNQQ